MEFQQPELKKMGSWVERTTARRRLEDQAGKAAAGGPYTGNPTFACKQARESETDLETQGFSAEN